MVTVYRIDESFGDKLVQACPSRKYFLNLLKINKKDFIMIDTQTEPLFDEIEFMGHSKNLLELFYRIEKWYRC